MKRPAFHASLAAALTAALLSCAAWPQAWPGKPIRWIVPFPAGGGVDLVARTLAARIGPRIGQQFVLENRSGANGNIGAELVAKAPPDGYTLLQATTGIIAINPHIYGKPTFDPMKELMPVARAVDSINVLVVHPALPVRSVSELIALAKARPNQLNFGSSGAGASEHVAAELFKSMTGTQLAHVPYKGGALAIIDVVAGQVETMFATIAVAVGPLKAGRLRPLGVTSRQRFEPLAEVPTIAEAGLPGYESAFWFSTFAPAGTPREIVTRLNAEIRSALEEPEIRQRLLASGLAAAGGTVDEFGAFVQAESRKWVKLVKDRGLRVD